MSRSGVQSFDLHTLELRPRLDRLVINPERERSAITQARRSTAPLRRLSDVGCNTQPLRLRMRE